MRVLIADDEPMHAFLLEMFLRKWGYEVGTVDNGQDALRILRQESEPCVAILDWKMPRLEGVDVCREVKLTPEKSNVYILLLTAKTQEVDRQQAAEAGVDLYMTKPYEPEELRGKLQEASRMLDSGQYSAPQEGTTPVPRIVLE